MALQATPQRVTDGDRLPVPDALASERALTLTALKQAVEMWNTEKREAYFVGEAAYTHWLKWLRDVEAGTVEDPKSGMQGNGWCYDVLIHSRRIAGRWLNEKAEVLGDEAAPHLRTAATHYTQLAELCIEGYKCPWDLTLPPDRVADWTSAMRQTQISRLEAARTHDRAAIEAIRQAL